MKLDKVPEIRLFEDLKKTLVSFRKISQEYLENLLEEFGKSP